MGKTNKKTIYRRIILAGIKNGEQEVLYWKIDKLNDEDIEFRLGDFAIVENMNGYDLVKIIGKLEIHEENSGYFSKTSYEKMKSAIKILSEIELENNSKGE